MEDFQAHEPEGAKDRRPVFFALMFVFLSAMFLIVFSNNMVWLFTGWEVTTVCSFLLIAYTRTEEAIKNAFRQIIMNLLGGIAFLVALYVMAIQFGTLSFLDFLVIGIQNPALVALPVCALAFAGLTKAAQMPFHTWLLGAMVAPTPTTRAAALLHHGEGGRVPAGEAGPGHVCGHHVGPRRVLGRRVRPHGHPGGRPHVRAVLVHGRLADQRQARAGVLHHRQPGPDHCLRGRGNA